ASVHVLVPVQPPPDQPVNCAPFAGCAVNVSVGDVPAPGVKLHCAGQLIPGGSDVTVPSPARTIDTVGLPGDPEPSGGPVFVFLTLPHPARVIHHSLSTSIPRRMSASFPGVGPPPPL